MIKRGADAFLAGLLAAGITHVFTLPGTQTLPLLRLIAEQGAITPVFVRSEQAAAYGAVGYARATGQPGVCLSVPGPGATNMVSGVAAAWADGIPLVAITPQLDDNLRNRHAVHECDLLALFAPIVKAQIVANSAEQFAFLLVRAAELARQAPMGPVHLQYPQSLVNAALDAAGADHPAVEARRDADGSSEPAATLDRVVELLQTAQRPVLYVGNEVTLRGAETLMVRLARQFDAPVFTDEDARGVIDETHRLALGCASHDTAVRAVEQADLCLAVGTRFSEWSTKSWTIQLPDPLVHITELPPSATPSYPAQIALTGRVDVLLRQLVRRAPAVPRTRSEWWRPSGAAEPVPDEGALDESRLHPSQVVDALADVLSPDTVITLDGSSSAMWMSQRYQVRQPRTFLQSEVFREIGSALMMGIGAAVAQSAPVVVVQGDGGMLFQLGELSSIAQAQLRMIVVVFEDGYYNADRLFQEHVYGGRLSDSAVHNPDYVAVAQSFGLRGARAGTPDEIRAAVRAAYDADTATIIAVPTIATAAPARLRERFVEWRRRLESADDGSAG